ncbi:MAG: DUF6178 family protein [Desulfobacterales bacterium]|jgi:hypothetical protein|nr:DUF6178 family protein [Desulfobacterales bacterium]
MTDDRPEKSAIERMRALQENRSAILALPPAQALDRILSDPQPAALVHSFPDTDLYLLIHDIGPEDALPLLALASDRQWDHVVDLESWERDRIQNSQLTRWLSLLLEADPRRFIRWFLTQRLHFVEFYLFHNLEVRVREHDQDPSDFGDDFFTLDNVYYLRFLKLPPAAEGATIGEEQRRQFLKRFIERLAAHDHLVFQNVLFEASHVLPAEAEEQEYRWRNVRLAEKGFLPFDEAVGIYQPVRPGDLKRRVLKDPPPPRGEAALLPVPALPLRAIGADNHFSRALAALEPNDALPRIQWEFSNLCNQIVVADRKSIRGREELREVVTKACGFLRIGLERLGHPEKELEPSRAAQELTRYPLDQLFRLGFGAALELKWRAEKWLAACWFGRSGLRLTFWGEQWMGVLGGILLKKPLFYDDYRTGRLYREFASTQDIAAAERILQQAQEVDHLFSVMRIRLKPPSRYGFLTWKNLLLTLWARQRLGMTEQELTPLGLKPFSRFFNELLPGAPPASGEPRRIADSMKAEFVQWLARATGLKEFEIGAKLGPVFEELFAEIEAEYGRVAVEDLDPRFVQLFLLKHSD